MMDKPVKPAAHKSFLDEFPAVGEAYERLGGAAHEAGPLDERTRELVKLALAIGARHEGAVHAHTRLALSAGASPAEIKHVVALTVTSLGMPTAVAAYTWVNDLLQDGDEST
ncbi:MAG: carboxymuconolactone decarboxylase family protein [Chloroflexota bacterium]